MSFPLATHWFERRRVSDDITLLWEPHVVPLMRCNIWHVRGRDRDLIVDIGNRHFEVLHLPGHSPGSIGLWEAASGTLFSGDAVYDGRLLDGGDDSDIDDYCTTMERLLELPVTVVHGGHDPSFGRDRLRQIARAYLDSRQHVRTRSHPGVAPSSI